MLFDCGEGTQRQMRIANIPFMRLGKIFISHFHADHCLGLGGLIQTMDLFKRQDQLQIFGPVGIEDVVEKIITTGHFVLEGFDLEINEVKSKKLTTIFANDDYSIQCAQLDHNVPCLGFSFVERDKRKFLKQKALKLGVPEGPLFSRLQRGESVNVGGRVIEPDQVLANPIRGRKVTYIPDTRPCAAAVQLAKGANLLIHESTFMHDLRDSAMEGRHSTAKEAAEIARRAGVGQLYLTHISQRYTKPKELENEAKGVFPESKIAKDFDIVTI
jgi:ribonuclease Z